MAKTQLEKQLEKQAKETKRLAEKEALRKRASSVVNGQPIKNGLRIMDKSSEEALTVLLDIYNKDNSYIVRFNYEMFPEYLQGSLNLHFEKLLQYGMISEVHLWITGSGEVTLLPNAISYFEEKENAEKGDADAFIHRNNNNQIFLVHGHDNEAKQTMARFLEKSGFEVIILHEQPDEGLTIIEKIEAYSNVGFAVVLYTECDLGRDKNDTVENEKYRARQNVVFEHGFLIGKLGRSNVCAIVKGDVQTPGDISGVIYTSMDAGEAWKVKLMKNLKASGMNVDMNNVF